MHANGGPLITKANGERELFHPEKLYGSLVNSGARADIAERITGEIASELTEGDRTTDIYKKAFRQLRKLERPAAARYSVKRALLELGPSGYPFEDFLGELYRRRGYTTSNRRIIPGRCVEHELDLLASRDDVRLAAEAKFHNNSGIKSDIKVALYVQARFDDIKAGAAYQSDHDFTDRMLITNTKFTEQAVIFAECVGLTLLSWDYPKEDNLRQLIEKTGVHPLPCLTTLSRAHKQYLMERGVVLCRQLHEHPDELDELGLSGDRRDALFREVNHLCQ